MRHVMSLSSFMFPNFSILFHLLSSSFMHSHLHRNISYCEVKLNKCMLSYSLESYIFSPVKVRTYRTLPSHTGFCGYCKLDQSYYGKNVDWRHLATECWWKCPYIIKLFLLWSVQSYVIVEVSVFLWCGSLSLGDVLRHCDCFIFEGRKGLCWVFQPLKMRPPHCPKTLGTNYQVIQCHIPKKTKFSTTLLKKPNNSLV